MFKAVIFPNRKAFNAVQTAVYNYYMARTRGVKGVVKRWSKGINAKTGNRVLMPVDDRLDGYAFAPGQVVDVSKTDPEWF